MNVSSGRAAAAASARGRSSMASMPRGGGGGCRRAVAAVACRGGGGGGFRGGGGGGGFRGGGGGGRRSDIALKHDIVLLGHLANGLGYYRFSYLGSDKAYVGVMAQEVEQVMPDAVTRGSDGYLRVHYDKLGLKFRTYRDWLAGGAKIPTRRCRHDRSEIASIVASLCVGHAWRWRLLARRHQAQQSYPIAGGRGGRARRRGQDRHRSDILKVLGRAAEDIVSSGDEVADADIAAALHRRPTTPSIRIKAEGNKKATLILGPDDFPFPIPLVNTKTGWEFDTAAGRHRDALSPHRPQRARRDPDLLSPMSMPRTNMPTRIAARAPASTRSASSARPARRTGCSGATTATRARSARWRREASSRRLQGRRVGPRRITAITSGS